MLGVYCPQHGRLVLIPVSEMDDLRRDATGFDVHFTCQCGYVGWQHVPTVRTNT